jgi:ABC-type methionine transport system ATPase subunit
MKGQKEKACERVYLTFPKDLVKEPIVCLLAKKFDITFNIRGSTVTAEMGIVALEIDGERAEVDKSIKWLKDKGVIVEPIEKNVIE